METIVLDKDIKLFYVTATSFPAGIMAAHEKLHKLVPVVADRKYFGLSRPEKDNGIVYRAAAEEMTEGEAEKLNCEALTIKKGRYISTMVINYLQDVQSIDRAFKKLLAVPGIDPEGYCVEWYVNDKDVNCLVRLEN